VERGAGAAHLARLGAVSRPAGSAAAADAREYCAGALHGLGCSVKESSFTYSRFPGAWAAPLLGATIALGASGLYLAQFWRWAGPSAAIVIVAAFTALGWLGKEGVLACPFQRRTGVNLEAVRGSARPSVWLVAHIDSKWQPVPMIARICSVVSSAIGLASLALLAFYPGAEARAVGAGLVIATWIAALPLMLSVVGARNHGTLDNASGVAAVLDAAERLPRSCAIGVLITDAEELALAGARAWARSAPPAVALNCDSVDDDGSLLVMYTRKPPDRLLGRMSRAASELGEPLRVLRLIPGILTDSVALADAGWETLTLSRGTIRTLQRIHTRRDTLAEMHGAGIDGAAAVLARVAMELVAEHEAELTAGSAGRTSSPPLLSRLDGEST
jgi:hypothetical protein